jgi:hypothetical protein
MLENGSKMYGESANDKLDILAEFLRMRVEDGDHELILFEGRSL